MDSHPHAPFQCPTLARPRISSFLLYRRERRMSQMHTARWGQPFSTPKVLFPCGYFEVPWWPSYLSTGAQDSDRDRQCGGEAARFYTNARHRMPPDRCPRIGETTGDAASRYMRKSDSVDWCASTARYGGREYTRVPLPALRTRPSRQNVIWHEQISKILYTVKWVK